VGYNQQWAAQRTAAVATQQAIRRAVDYGPDFGATRAATDTGAITSSLAAYDPCALAYGPSCWYDNRWGRKLMRGKAAQ